MTKKDTRKGDRHTSAGRLVRAPQELWDALDTAAEHEGISATEAVRQAVALWSGLALSPHRHMLGAPSRTQQDDPID